MISKPRYITAILDCQFGSTGKGLIAGYLAERDAPDTVVTAWAANAGHTYIDSKGRKFVHTMLANGVVSPGLRAVLIGPGSIIDPDNLYREMVSCADLLEESGARVYIHQNAAVIAQRHRDEEAGPMTKIGSTKKGVGAAAIQRIRRDPDDLNTVFPYLTQIDHPILQHVTVVSPRQYADLLNGAEVIQIEGAQGYSLSMYHGMYPYSTSRDVSTAQLMADCGIPFAWAREVNVVGTARTFPIRVANRFDEAGKQVGYSGPCYSDQSETTFEAIGQQTELTTVTKLPRRIFTFSEQQIAEAIRACGVDEIFLNFCNYAAEEELARIVKAIKKHAPVRYKGWGPTRDDVRESPL